MNRLRRDALLVEVVDQLRLGGSWCGETHLQKAVYFLQTLRDVPFDFEFILYKHGPFSFDLRDELTVMRADWLLELQAQWPYGPSLIPTPRSTELRKNFPKTLKSYRKDIQFVCEAFGDRNVAELEKLATALYVYFEHRSRSQHLRAKVLHELKPHISLPDSLDAVKQVDRLKELSVQF